VDNYRTLLLGIRLLWVGLAIGLNVGLGIWVGIGCGLNVGLDIGRLLVVAKSVDGVLFVRLVGVDLLLGLGCDLFCLVGLGFPAQVAEDSDNDEDNYKNSCNDVAGNSSTRRAAGAAGIRVIVVAVGIVGERVGRIGLGTVPISVTAVICASLVIAVRVVPHRLRLFKVIPYL